MHRLYETLTWYSKLEIAFFNAENVPSIQHNFTVFRFKKEEFLAGLTVTPHRNKLKENPSTVDIAVFEKTLLICSYKFLVFKLNKIIELIDF